MDQTNPQQADPQQAVQVKKHIKAFWPLVIIFAAAVLMGVLVFWYKFNLVTDYELQSMVLTVHRRGEKLTNPDSGSQQTKIPATTTSTPNIF